MDWLTARLPGRADSAGLTQLDAGEGLRQHRGAIALVAADEAGLIGFGVELHQALDSDLQVVDDPVVAEIPQQAHVLAGGKSVGHVLALSHRQVEQPVGLASHQAGLPQVVVVAALELADHAHRVAVE